MAIGERGSGVMDAGRATSAGVKPLMADG